MSELLDERRTARILDIAPGTLAVWRCQGKGPPFVKVGRAVRYDPIAVARWISDRVRKSTSDTTAEPAGSATE